MIVNSNLKDTKQDFTNLRTWLRRWRQTREEDEGGTTIELKSRPYNIYLNNHTTLPHNGQ